jgi:hypothetical protein
MQFELSQPNPFCNIQTTENPLKNLESMMSKSYNTLIKSKVLNKILKKLEKENPQEIKNSATLSVSERYKISWQIIFKQQSHLRQKEIDESIKSDTFGSSERDKNFVRQVVSLAESNSPIETSN